MVDLSRSIHLSWKKTHCSTSRESFGKIACAEVGFSEVPKLVLRNSHLESMLSTAFSRNISCLVDIVNNVNIVYSVNSVYTFRFVFLFVFCLSFAVEMGFNAKYVCEKHDAWCHGPREGPADRVRVVDPYA